MLAALLAVGCIAAAVAFAVLAYRRDWRWTGLPGDDSVAGSPRPAKTLWDWLQLLIVPLVLAFAAFALSTAQSGRERRQEDRREAEQRRLEARRAAREQAAADDRAREETLHTYLQQMSELITQHGIRAVTHGSPNADTATLARTLTLVTLRRLDGRRKGLVVQYLLEAKLITRTWVWRSTKRGLERGANPAPTVSLAGADLREAVMPSSLFAFIDAGGPRGAWRTNAAVFDETDLERADFRGASVEGVSFDYADLTNANFRGSTVSTASFRGACLSGASFRDAKEGLLNAGPDFSLTAGSEVDFSHAWLENASFLDARLANASLNGARTRGVRWPPHWTPTGLRMNANEARQLCRDHR
jgi:uncharacterized protein YjbI with pentapeptide repeats